MPPNGFITKEGCHKSKKVEKHWQSSILCYLKRKQQHRLAGYHLLLIYLLDLKIFSEIVDKWQMNSKLYSEPRKNQSVVTFKLQNIRILRKQYGTLGSKYWTPVLTHLHARIALKTYACVSWLPSPYLCRRRRCRCCRCCRDRSSKHVFRLFCQAWKCEKINMKIFKKYRGKAFSLLLLFYSVFTEVISFTCNYPAHWLLLVNSGHPITQSYKQF